MRPRSGEKKEGKQGSSERRKLLSSLFLRCHTSFFPQNKHSSWRHEGVTFTRSSEGDKVKASARGERTTESEPQPSSPLKPIASIDRRLFVLTSPPPALLSYLVLLLLVLARGGTRALFLGLGVERLGLLPLVHPCFFEVFALEVSSPCFALFLASRCLCLPSTLRPLPHRRREEREIKNPDRHFSRPTFFPHLFYKKKKNTLECRI